MIFNVYFNIVFRGFQQFHGGFRVGFCKVLCPPFRIPTTQWVLLAIRFPHSRLFQVLEVDQKEKHLKENQETYHHLYQPVNHHLYQPLPGPPDLSALLKVFRYLKSLQRHSFQGSTIPRNTSPHFSFETPRWTGSSGWTATDLQPQAPGLQ